MCCIVLSCYVLRCPVLYLFCLILSVHHARTHTYFILTFFCFFLLLCLYRPGSIERTPVSNGKFCCPSEQLQWKEQAGQCCPFPLLFISALDSRCVKKKKLVLAFVREAALLFAWLISTTFGTGREDTIELLSTILTELRDVVMELSCITEDAHMRKCCCFQKWSIVRHDSSRCFETNN